jgi:dTDP-4-dehydrorhamnose reductase
MSRILLLGAAGQLGMQLKKKLSGQTDLIALTRSEVDFADPDAVRKAVRDAAPEVVINAAAYTAVDRAESEQDLAYKVNAVSPGVLAEEVARRGGWLLHYSTDYVFDGSGTKPWQETDPTGPLGVYGQTKLAGELAISETGCRHITMRTSWVYAAEGKNFLHTMLRLGRERDQLKVVDDQIGAPTSAEAITQASLVVLDALPGLSTDAQGTYHLACGGQTSWCGFASAIFAAFASTQRAPELIPIPTESYPTPAQRPKNSRLDCARFRAQFDFAMPGWEAALQDVSQALVAHQQAP